ncbi:hypothetical protein JOM56_011285 [Amanita muscaria]
MLPTHLAVLHSTAQRVGSAPAFQVPHPNADIHGWETITYEKFKDDVEATAKYWSSILDRDSIPKGSIVGLWLWGFSYTDVLHIYGLSRAGFVPQLFSLRLPNPTVIYELLEMARAKALICEHKFEAVITDCPLPHYRAVRREEMTVPDATLPKLSGSSLDDTAFIFHTSGSTSGSPKLVPFSHRWINTVFAKCRQVCKPKNPNRQDVTVWMGSMCHIAQSFMFMGYIQHGSCVVQPTNLSFASDELVSMVRLCGVNRLNQFASLLRNHFKSARSDPKLLSVLQNLDEVLYTGLPLPVEDEVWARKNGIKLRNVFGSTECGIMLSSNPVSHNGGLLSPMDGFLYQFVPIAEGRSPGHQSTARLLELVILAESPDCPDRSLRDADGNFHTGDLFYEVAPGQYTFRGRDDDWIKTEISLRCDTKAIEDNIRQTCGDLVSECVVVGAGRPSPALFIEPTDIEMDHNELKKTIIRKTRHFHSRRYVHERISSADMIVIVPPRTLPRTATKGNVRRKAVEEAYKPLLDELYGRAL